MPNVRNDSGPLVQAALIAQVNALITDLTAVRTALLGGLDRSNNAVLSRIRRTDQLADLAALRAAMLVAIDRVNADVLDNGGLVDGSTDGKLQTANAISYRIAGRLYSKAATDDLFDLTSETDTAADKYRAYQLYLDAAGTASVVAQSGDDSDSEAEAIAALPAEDAAKAMVGVYVAGLSCDFDGAAGLAAQGTIINGRPSAASDPAALVTTTDVSIDDGTTTGALQLVADLEYMIGGQIYTKVETDDLWDLSGETDTAADKYRAYRLYLDAAGAATAVASTTDGDDAAGALANLPAEDASLCQVGLFIADPSCDFDGAALSGQGTIYDGRYSAQSDPAALTSEAITLVSF
jgi:hypothetical protein